MLSDSLAHLLVIHNRISAADPTNYHGCSGRGRGVQEGRQSPSPDKVKVEDVTLRGL